MYFGQKISRFLTVLIMAVFVMALVAVADAKTTVVTHKITVTQSTGGTIAPRGSGTPAKVSVRDGKDSAFFTVLPKTGYTVASIVTDAGDVTSLATKTGKGYKYKFTKVTGDHTITATFAKISYTLTVNLSGPDSTGRTVTSDTGSLTCNDTGTSCTGSFEYGTLVTLTETPGLNSELQKWIGCKAQSDTCTVTVKKNTTVSAKFTAATSSANIPDTVSGEVQKGPFLNGTTVTIYELDNELNPTGKSFDTQTDDRGAFELSNVSLASQYVELKADGYYYNEVAGSISTSTLTLYALVDLADKSTINVNVLTHLERNRVKTLIAKGYAFADAKKQAQKEILQIFEISKDSIAASEALDLSKDGEDNGILLAISVILQGNRTEGELSELLANMVTDLEDDGALTTSANGSALINAAKYINITTIRETLAARYTALGTTATIPDITTITSNFIANTEFQLTEFITYPENGVYGANVLDKNRMEYQSYDPDSLNKVFYSLAAVLPKGRSLKVKISGESCNWGYVLGSIQGWLEANYSGDCATYFKTFDSTQTGNLDLKLVLLGGKVTLDVYEDGATSPTWTRTITAQ